LYLPVFWRRVINNKLDVARRTLLLSYDHVSVEWSNWDSDFFVFCR